MANTIRSSITQLYQLLRPYLKGKKLPLIVIVVGILLQIILTVVLPVAYKHLFDEVAKQVFHVGIIIGLVFFMVGVMIYGVLSDYVLAKVSTQICNSIRTNIQKAIDNMPFDFFKDATVITNIISHFNVDIRNINNILVRILPTFIGNSLQAILSYVVMFFFNPILALIMCITIPLATFVPGALWPKARKAQRQKDMAEVVLINHIRESMFMHPVISAFYLSSFWEEQFENKIVEHTKLEIMTKFLSQVVERIVSFSFNMFEIAIFAIGAVAVFYGYISVGTWLGFFVLSQIILRSFSRLSAVFSLLPESFRTVERLTDFFHQTIDMQPNDGTMELAPFKGKILFDKVRFGYTANKVNVNEVSFSINAGESVAFVGSSGSGKSTILALLMDFYAPQDGKILIDNCSLAVINTASYRRQIAVIMQDSRLFDMTIRDNIRVGRLDASDEEVIEAAKAAELHSTIISMPQGYDTMLVDQGNNLSGGQRQRVAIARALLRKPQILFGDEITAALDPATEAAVNETLMRFAKKCTFICVTHRLKSAVDMDRIFVMEQGKLVESGNHQELLDLQGAYYQLWSKQNSVSVSVDGQSAHVSLDLLRKIPLLQSLNDAILATFADRLVMESYEEDQLLFQQGAVGDKFYIIVRGSVEVKKTDAAGVKQRIAVLEEGDYFGEIALIKDVPRNASVYTKMRCIFLTLNRSKFLQIFNQSADLRAELERIMQMRLLQ